MAQRYHNIKEAEEAFIQACFHLAAYTQPFRHGFETNGMAADFNLPDNYDLKAYLIMGSAKCRKDDTTRETTGILPRLYTSRSSSRRYRRPR